MSILHASYHYVIIKGKRDQLGIGRLAFKPSNFDSHESCETVSAGVDQHRIPVTIETSQEIHAI